MNAKIITQKFIRVTFQKEGIHCYPKALRDPDLADVEFLGYPHRHMFHFNVCIEVLHTNREIEFIQFKRWLMGLYEEKVLELNHKSCEMMIDELYEKIYAKYPERSVLIDISEDGENGATGNFIFQGYVE